LLLSILLNIIAILSLLGITLQDLKERKVYVWLFVLCGFLLGFLHFKEVFYQQFFLTALINCCTVLVIVLMLFTYSKIVLKKSFKNTFGSGDVLFFLILAIGFPTATFLVLFSFSLLFSMVLYFLLKNNTIHKTVPLAGLQALFICVIFIVNWIFNFSDLYTI
jgi:hypothetical protein